MSAKLAKEAVLSRLAALRAKASCLRWLLWRTIPLEQIEGKRQEPHCQNRNKPEKGRTLRRTMLGAPPLPIVGRIHPSPNTTGDYDKDKEPPIDIHAEANPITFLAGCGQAHSAADEFSPLRSDRPICPETGLPSQASKCYLVAAGI